MQYGTRTEENAKIAPSARRSDVRKRLLRNAKLAPRNTIPRATRVRGTKSVSVIDSKASGNAVQSTTSAKINHTWLASHTGPMEWSMSARGRSPLSAPPATRSQNPAPKSAPARTA